MKEYLKVKIKSLAAEAVFIRKEENKAKANYRYLKRITGKEAEYDRFQNLHYGLHQHRTVDVRMEARATQWAYAFIRGKQFNFVERNTNPYDRVYGDSLCSSLNPIISRTVKMVQKYHSRNVDFTDIQKWIKNTNTLALTKKAA